MTPSHPEDNLTSYLTANRGENCCTHPYTLTCTFSYSFSSPSRSLFCTTRAIYIPHPQQTHAFPGTSSSLPGDRQAWRGRWKSIQHARIAEFPARESVLLTKEPSSPEGPPSPLSVFHFRVWYPTAGPVSALARILSEVLEKWTQVNVGHVLGSCVQSRAELVSGFRGSDYVRPCDRVFTLQKPERWRPMVVHVLIYAKLIFPFISIQ